MELRALVTETKFIAIFGYSSGKCAEVLDGFGNSL